MCVKQGPYHCYKKWTKNHYLNFLEMDGFKDFVELKEVRQWMELKAVELVIDGFLRIRNFWESETMDEYEIASQISVMNPRELE